MFAGLPTLVCMSYVRRYVCMYGYGWMDACMYVFMCCVRMYVCADRTDGQTGTDEAKKIGNLLRLMAGCEVKGWAPRH